MRTRTSTLLFFFLSLCFSASVLANRSLPTFSAPEDSVANLPATHPVADTLTSKKPVVAPTLIAGGDLCGQGTGFVDLTPDPNTPGPYFYLWSNGETTQDITDLTPGGYTVTIVDGNGNTQVGMTIVQSLPPISPLSVTAVTTGNTLCDGTGNGAIDLTVTPDPTVFSYEWSSGQTTMDISGLVPGVYTVSVTYGVTCTTTASFTVANLTNAPTIFMPVFTPDACDLSNGTAGFGAIGGVMPYTYEWSNGTTNPLATGLAAGTYTVTITGANGCSTTASGTVVTTTYAVDIPSATVVANTNCNNPNGSIDINVLPSGPTYTYLWSNGETTQDISNLPSGSYRVTVTRAGTCTATDVWYIEQEPALPGLSFSMTSASCGLNNGGINLTTLPGGVPPYTFLWSTGQTSEDLSNIPTGTYDVTITSANGCTVTGSTMVEDNPAVFGYSANVIDQTACDTINGQISLSLFPSNLAYQWSNGATSTTLKNLAPGDYTVTISAGGTCTAIETYNVGDVREYPSIPIAPTASTCGRANGIANLTVTGGLTPLSYQWSNGATTEDLINIKADTFMVTVTSAVGCSAVNTVIVPNVNPPITIAADVLDNISCSAPTGSINLNVTPVDTAYHYLWSSGQTIDSLINLTGGTYAVTVTLGLTCVAADTFDIQSNALPPILAATGTAAVCSQNNGAVDLSVSGGATPYQFNWSNTATSEDLNNLPPGNYSVTVTGANTCTAVSSVNVSDNNIVININATPAGNSSCVADNGAIDLSISPAGTYNYTWSNAAATEDLANLAAGTYTVTVSTGSCQSSSTFIVPDNTTAPVLNSNITASICGASNGSIDLVVTGPSAPFTYLWSNSLNTEDLSNLLPGNYTVTVTAQNGCTTTSTINVPNNALNFSLSGTTSDLTNCAANNGAIDLSISTTGTFAIQWSNNEITEDISGLAPGTYTVSVTEMGSCTATASFFIVDQRVNPIAAQAVVPEVCGQSNGSIDISVNGGAAPYNYLWSSMQTSQDLTNIGAGSYTVTVTDSNGCTTTAGGTVPDNSISFSVNGTTTANSSCVASDGSIDLTISPPAAYTYAWSNMSGTEDIANIAAGSYTVTVSAGGTCTSTAVFAITNNTPSPILIGNITDDFCAQGTGAIDLGVSGSPAPYAYNWSTTAAVEDLSSLAAGTYSVTVTGANGCSSTDSYLVTQSSITPDISSQATASTSCVANNGAIDLTVSPVLSYTFTWSNSTMTEDLNNVAAGSYTVTVSAGGACTNTATIMVNSDVPLPMLTDAITADFCAQGVGAIDLSVSGSPAPYVYNWSTTAAVEDINNLLAGTYSVTVTAANGCSTVQNYTVAENTISPTINNQITSATSCVVSNGAIDLTVSPVLPYTFNWSNTSMSEDLNNVAAGIYTVTVSAGGTCTNTAVVTVTSNVPPPALSDATTADFCAHGVGAIDLSVSGSPAPYVYNWSTTAAVEDINNLLAGTYTVTVTASNGCSTVQSFVVTETTLTPNISNQSTDATSCVVSNGAIDLTVTPPMAYTFVWSNMSSTEDLSNIAAGSYTVTVSAGGACTNTANISVASNTVPVSLGAQGVAVSCFGDATGTIDVTISTGTAPYTYNWSNAAPGNPEDLSGLAAGTYTVTVTDNNGCTNSISIAVTQPAAALGIQCAATNQVSEPGMNDGAGAVNISGGTGPYTVSWTNGNTQTSVPAGNFPIPNLAENTYGITVTDNLGCPATCSFTIDLASCATAVGVMSQTPQVFCGPGCITAVYNANGQVLGPNDGIQFVLHQGTGTQISGEIARSNQPSFCFDPATMAYGTTYYISAVAGVDDASGNVDLNSFCSVVAQGTPIKFVQKPVASSIAPTPLNCITAQTALTGSSDLPGATFQWSTQTGTIVGASNQATISAAAAGTYTLIIQLNGCADTTTVAVVDNSNQPTASITSQAGTVINCSTTSITLNGIAGGASNPTTVWAKNNTVLGNGNTLAVTTSGVYNFVVLDPVSFCADTASITITQNQTPPALTIMPPAVITCTNPGITLSGNSSGAGIQFTWASITGTDTTLLGNNTNLPVSAAGTYYLFGLNPVNQCENAVSVVVTANQNPPVADAGQPYTLDCAGETAALTGSGTGAANLSYQWSSQDGHFVSGANTASPLIDEPGTYLLTVTNPANGCTATDQVIIEPEIPVAYASVIQPSCLDEKGTLKIDSVTGLSDPILYALNDGTPGVQSQFSGLDPGTYTVSVQGGNGCTATLTTEVNEPQLLNITVTPEALIDLGYTYQINAQVNIPPSDIASVLWTPADGLSCDTCLVTDATPFTSTRYFLLVTSESGCTAETTVVIKVDKSRDIYVPNIFTPNEDGVNDFFNVFADPVTVTKIKSFQVFSRWGEAVYELKDFVAGSLSSGWDGTYKGEKMNPGVFVWQVVVEYVDGKEEFFKGDVTLQR